MTKLLITDERTGRKYEVPVHDGTVDGKVFHSIRTNGSDPGLLVYDPAYFNTAACRSSVTYIDGDRGILLYRGYPIEQLAEKSHYLEVACLLIHGELPTQNALARWTEQVTVHTMLHENLKKFMDGFLYDAHPMGILVSTLAALSTFYKDAKQVEDPEVRRLQMIRLIGKMITLAAYSYRHSMGLPYVMPDNDLSYAGNFLSMMFKMAEPKYKPHPVLERALDMLFVLHADHEQNASTSVMRSAGSTRGDPFTTTAAAAATLYGPLHGGANEAVLKMLREIGSVKNVPEFLKKVVSGERRLSGFGHRVYKNYDPRGRIIKRMAYEVFEVTGKNPLLDIALELERIALQDDYFVSRKLYPNVDFYSGLIYQSMKFPVEMFPVLFAIGRTAGWLAQWEEMIQDSEQKIARPRQIYTGAPLREYQLIGKRD
ncbi:MAG: citrate synthase [Deltaproteobacteria bacterium]|nr:citrate synthase [Deltaproteobacteria bacterium]